MKTNFKNIDYKLLFLLVISIFFLMDRGVYEKIFVHWDISGNPNISMPLWVLVTGFIIIYLFLRNMSRNQDSIHIEIFSFIILYSTVFIIYVENSGSKDDIDGFILLLNALLVIGISILSYYKNTMSNNNIWSSILNYGLLPFLTVFAFLTLKTIGLYSFFGVTFSIVLYTFIEVIMRKWFE